MTCFTIQTPAKVNTRLYILHKRQDGFHELWMHMVPISLFDSLRFKPASALSLQTSVKDLSSGEENLVIRAVRAFEKASGRRQHWTIELEKRIPMGAGLGGGSGNAAGTLQAMNYLNGNPLSAAQLGELAAQLGSDVPFFLEPRPAIARGRGEQLEALPGYPTFALIVVKPPFAIPTVQAYRGCQPASLPENLAPVQNLSDLVNGLYNQFEVTLLPSFPVLGLIQQTLKSVGALGTLVSGSGSAVFGLFDSALAQQIAFKQLSNQELGQVFACEALLGHRYC